MEVILRGEPKEIAALVVGLQERQISEITEKVTKQIAEDFNYLLSSSRIPE